MNDVLAPTAIIDADHPSIRAFVDRVTAPGDNATTRAVKLFDAVRDGVRYDPFHIDFRPEGFRASATLDRGTGHCMEKAALLVAAYRAADLPARIGLAKVRNHIATEKLEAFLGSDILTPHGYVEVLLNETWWKVTPAFNIELCERLGVPPLTFDGSSHCLFQAYDRSGGDFMDYLEDYGWFTDVPVQFIVETMRAHYPKLFRNGVPDVVEID